MSTPCISLSDFEMTNRLELNKLREIARSDDECGRFADQAQAVERLLRMEFQCAAIMARKTESCEETVSIWKQMVGFCDAVLNELRELTAIHPQCGDLSVCDYALDCRNAAAQRMELHS